MTQMNFDRLVGCLAILLLTLGFGVAAPAADGHEGLDAAFEADGRTFRIVATGVMDFRASFSASIQLGGRRLVLSSTEGERIGSNIRFAGEGVELFCRLEEVDGMSGVLLQAGIRNTGTAALKLISVTPLAMEGQLEGSLPEWLVTAMVESAAEAPPVVAISDIFETLGVHEYGGLYRPDGNGFFFGPVGTPIAYVNAEIAHSGEGEISFRFSADMSGVRVDPGETRWGQQVLLLMEPPAKALAHWADCVAETHGARTSEGALSGWSSSAFSESEATGEDVLAVVDALRELPERLRPQVIQIDRGYEDPIGEAEVNERFPKGLAFYARRISAVGSRAGLSLRFSGINVNEPMASPQLWSTLIQRAREAERSGFTYLKIDCSNLSFPAASETRQTSFEGMRSGFAHLRKAVGDGTYLLYSGPHPDRATVGAVDASQTAGSGQRETVRSHINDVLRSYVLQDRWFAVDNNVYYTESFGLWPMARTWMSMVGLSCGAAITSDPWQLDSIEPYRRSVHLMTPPARERIEVADLCTSRHWPRLVRHITRDWGEWTVALLWNPGATEQSVRLHFADAGLDPTRRYAVWSFWDNRFLGVAKGAWTTPLLAPSTSQHLCFTKLDRESERPVLIGSNLHIFCGAAEVTNVERSRGRMRIELGNAGAREGDLFVYSRWPPFVKSAIGCTVKAVDGAGENVWQVRIEERQSGVHQRVELGILLPATLQAWFWLLIATVVASLLFAARRYVVSLRLEREHVLDQERTRIAGDIHDEVGANLTQISILSSLAARRTTKPETAREYNLEMFNVARQTIQSLEEIVWSINPKSDSIMSVAHFICRRAEELLEAGDVECRITLDEELPNRLMKPRRRHGLLLAFKEAINNILKHAGARRVHVQCMMDDKVFEVCVSDDGCGFDSSAVATKKGRQGNGLVNMRRRLTELGGACSIESSSVEGTRVCFRLPLDVD
jgi:signal transduction histidine kinase